MYIIVVILPLILILFSLFGLKPNINKELIL